METQTEKKMIESSGKLRAENGTGSFTPDALSKQSGMQVFDIFTLVRKEEEVFEQLLLQLEKDLTAIVNDISAKKNSPATEFEMLFKKVHRLFKQKPYYLTLIFDKDLRHHYSGADKIVSRIKSMAKKYLAGIIDRGKEQKIFTINTETKILVKKILSSFQALMNNIQLADKLMRDLKKHQSSND